jgi:hypothetical protein
MGNDTITIILGFVGVIAVLAGSAYLTIWLSKRKLSNEKSVKYPEILELLHTVSITNVAFIRNKIVLDVEDIDSFPAEALQQAGAKGISIVGSRVKFYVDGLALDIENLYNDILEHEKGE